MVKQDDSEVHILKSPVKAAGKRVDPRQQERKTHPQQAGRIVVWRGCHLDIFLLVKRDAQDSNETHDHANVLDAHYFLVVEPNPN